MWSGECSIRGSHTGFNTLRLTLKASTPTKPIGITHLVGRSLSQPQVTLPTGDAVPLDAVLGTGWALLYFPQDSRASFEVRRVESERLVNGVNHDGGPHLPPTGVTAVTDTSGAFAAVAGTGMTLLVRPDRYVAAATTPDTEQAAFEALAAYVPGLARLRNVGAGTPAAR